MPRDAQLPQRLHSRSFGVGPVRALALHCGLGHGGMWKALSGALGDGVEIVAPDLPGHGRSAPFPAGLDVHDAAVAACLPFMAPGTNLIGHSFAATVALRLALEDPGAVASLTLVEPVFFAAARGTPEFDRHRVAEESYFDPFRRGELSVAARMFNRLWGGGIAWDDLSDKARRDMAARMPFVAATEPSLWHDCHDMLAANRLETLTCKVTLLRGAETLPIIAEVHRGLCARLPRATETIIPGAGHMLPLTHAPAMAKVIAPQVSA